MSTDTDINALPLSYRRLLLTQRTRWEADLEDALTRINFLFEGGWQPGNSDELELLLWKCAPTLDGGPGWPIIWLASRSEVIALTRPADPGTGRAVQAVPVFTSLARLRECHPDDEAACGTWMGLRPLLDVLPAHVTHLRCNPESAIAFTADRELLATAVGLLRGSVT